jgi:D-lyxose ketol-isomerase
MKRSEINAILRDAIAFLKEYRFALPGFAYWTPAEWATRGPEFRDIVTQQLGWDITDFGSGNFAQVGLFLFTLRNGSLDDPNGKTYAEKIMIVQENQLTPTHYHSQKMEDIINRGGGNLQIRMWNADDKDGLGGDDVTVSMDGQVVTVPAGATVTLHPGDSITLPQKNYHRFWGQPGQGPVLVGEVSRVNDDRVDNRFYDEIGRFPDIEEDEEPLHLLACDYPNWYRHG